MRRLRPALATASLVGAVALALLPALAAAQGGAAPLPETVWALPPPVGEGWGGGRTSVRERGGRTIPPLPASPRWGEETDRPLPSRLSASDGRAASAPVPTTSTLPRGEGQPTDRRGRGEGAAHDHVALALPPRPNGQPPLSPPVQEGDSSPTTPLGRGGASSPAPRRRGDGGLPRPGGAAWSTLTPAVGAGVPLGAGYGPEWETGPTVTFRVEAPAYGGRVRAEVRAAGYGSVVEGVPAFSTLSPTVGWGPALRLGPVRLGAGARVGVVRFQIDDDAAGRLQSETELTVGGWGGVAVGLDRVEVWAEADGARVALSDPVALWTVGGGVAVRLGTPGWLRAVLR